MTIDHNSGINTDLVYSSSSATDLEGDTIIITITGYDTTIFTVVKTINAFAIAAVDN